MTAPATSPAALQFAARVADAPAYRHWPPIDRADAVLHSFGYHLRHADPEQGGIWLANKFGAVWFPCWQDALKAVTGETRCAVMRK